MDPSGTSSRVPVKLYRTDDRITIAAPMPGLEPGDISVEVTGDRRLILQGELRGVFKGDKDVLLDEWQAGDYHREIELPSAVDAALANVTYGNGVLVVVLPTASEHRAGNLFLETISATRGERVGSSGHPVEARSMGDHLATAHNVSPGQQ